MKEGRKEGRPPSWVGAMNGNLKIKWWLSEDYMKDYMKEGGRERGRVGRTL